MPVRDKPTKLGPRLWGQAQNQLVGGSLKQRSIVGGSVVPALPHGRSVNLGQSLGSVHLSFLIWRWGESRRPPRLP